MKDALAKGLSSTLEKAQGHVQGARGTGAKDPHGTVHPALLKLGRVQRLRPGSSHAAQEETGFREVKTTY